MTNLIEKTGGTAPVDGQVYNAQDFIDSTNTLIAAAMKGTAQHAYQTLKHAGSFDNEDFLAADRFTDTNGVNNTVNTGSTTATYDGTGYYSGGNITCDSNLCKLNESENSLLVYVVLNGAEIVGLGDGTDVVDAHGVSLSSTSGGANNERWGIKVTSKGDCVIGKVTKHSGCDATKAYLRDINDNILSTTTFAGDDATFEDGFILRNGVSYIIDVDDNGANYTDKFTNSASYPYSETNLDLIETYLNGSFNSSTEIRNIISITTQTLTSEAIKSTYATIDATDGTTTITSKSSNTPFAIDTLSYGNLGIDINLDDSSNTYYKPKLYGYGVYIN